MKPSGIGGQAVLEGVMMKNQEAYAVAVRKPDKQIVVEKKEFHGIAERFPFLGWIFIRGVVNFVESMVLGMRTLTFSASFYEEEDQTEPSEFEKKLIALMGEKAEAIMMGCTVAVSIVLAVGIFMLLPFWIASLLERIVTSPTMLTLIEGLIRITIFISYVLAISMMKDIRRVFMYHGAEHKSINCIEHGFPLTVENVKRQSTRHKRCGTSFMLFVIILSALFFMFIRVDNMWLRMLFRILLIPVIAGVSYEIIKLAGRSESKAVEILSKPGLWLQGLTTREPDEDMIEVAIRSVEAVFDWKAFLEEAEDVVSAVEPLSADKSVNKIEAADEVTAETAERMELSERFEEKETVAKAAETEPEEQTEQVLEYSEEMLESEETIKSEGMLKSEETIKSEKKIKSEEKIKSEKKIRSEKKIKSEETVKPEEKIKSEEMIKPEEKIKSEETIESEETKKSEETTNSKEAIKSKETIAAAENTIPENTKVSMRQNSIQPAEEKRVKEQKRKRTETTAEGKAGIEPPVQDKSELLKDIRLAEQELAAEQEPTVLEAEIEQRQEKPVVQKRPVARPTGTRTSAEASRSTARPVRTVKVTRTTGTEAPKTSTTKREPLEKTTASEKPIVLEKSTTSEKSVVSKKPMISEKPAASGELTGREARKPVAAKEERTIRKSSGKKNEEITQEQIEEKKENLVKRARPEPAVKRESLQEKRNTTAVRASMMKQIEEEEDDDILNALDRFFVYKKEENTEQNRVVGGRKR